MSNLEVGWGSGSGLGDVSASPTWSKVGNSTGKNGKGNIYKAGKKHRFQQPPLADPQETVLVPAGFGR